MYCEHASPPQSRIAYGTYVRKPRSNIGMSRTYRDRMLILSSGTVGLFFDESDDIIDHRTEHFDQVLTSSTQY